jgi:hypothetical protein
VTCKMHIPWIVNWKYEMPRKEQGDFLGESANSPFQSNRSKDSRSFTDSSLPSTIVKDCKLGCLRLNSSNEGTGCCESLLSGPVLESHSLSFSVVNSFC